MIVTTVAVVVLAAIAMGLSIVFFVIPPDDPAQHRLERLWRELADDDADRAYQATRPLVAGAEQSVPFLKAHVRPVATDLKVGL